MDVATEYAVSVILIGAGATAVTDVWAIARKRLSGVAAPDFGLVGRWVAYMPRGRFRHESIAKSPPMPHESAIGWTAHYLIGIAFAAILLAIFGLEWARHPTIGPALVVGIGTVAAPFLIMQPGMGAGIAASRTPNPSAARLRSLVAHAVFGIGLYVVALCLSLIRG
jgi:hypothetical protein